MFKKFFNIAYKVLNIGYKAACKISDICIFGVGLSASIAIVFYIALRIINKIR